MQLIFYVIRGISGEWFKNYLNTTGRKQKINPTTAMKITIWNGALYTITRHKIRYSSFFLHKRK